MPNPGTDSSVPARSRYRTSAISDVYVLVFAARKAVLGIFPDRSAAAEALAEVAAKVVMDEFPECLNGPAQLVSRMLELNKVFDSLSGQRARVRPVYLESRLHLRICEVQRSTDVMSTLGGGGACGTGVMASRFCRLALMAT